MTPERFEQISSGGWVRFADRTIYRVTGEDRVRYLSGQLSNAVAKASKETVYACVLDVKGRLQGELFLHEGNGFHLIDAPAVLREPLAARLDRYLVADDVLIESAEDDWVLLHRFDPDSEAASTALDAALPEGSISRPADRLGAPGLDLLLPSTQADEWLASSAAAEAGLSLAELLDDEEAAIVALLRGRPIWNAGLEEGRLLPEAGIEDRAVDYHKGCYVGQEVVSRIRSAGKINWTLRPLSAELSGLASSPPAPGSALFDQENEGKEVGRVAACIRHPCLDRFSALAYVRSSVDDDQALFLSISGEENKLVFTAPSPKTPH